MNISCVIPRIDTAIRFFLYWVIFWLPYSKAVVEVFVIISVFFWLVKRALRFLELRSQSRGTLIEKDVFTDLRQALALPTNCLTPAIGLFVCICFMSVLVSPIFVQSLDGFINKMLEWFAIFFLVLEVFTTRKQIYFALGIFFFTTFSTGLDSLYQFYVSHQDIFNHQKLTEGYRATAGFSHSNLLGGYLALAVPVSLSLLFLKVKKSRRLLYSLVFLVLGWSLVLTFSRGAWMAACVGMVFLICMFLHRRAENSWIKNLLLVLVVAVSMTAVTQAFVFKKQVSLVGNDTQTVQWRIDLWQASLQLMSERAFFGHGLNTYMPLMEEFLITTQSPLGIGFSPSYAHNCYLQMAVEIGIFGLTAFAAMILLLFQQIIRFQPEDETARVLQMGLLAGLLAFLAHSFVDMNFYSVQLPALFWLMAGLLISLNKLSNTKKYAIK